MKRGRRAAQVSFALIAILLAALAWIGRPQPQPHPRLQAAVAPPSPSATTGSQPRETWDLDADIGSIMVLSWRASGGWTPAEEELVDDQIGGVLLFTPNFGGSPAGLRQLSSRLEALASRTCLGHPILEMLDEEGGAVANVKAPFAPPWPAVMGTGGPDHVRQLEQLNGAGLRAAGIGLNLAPVADVRTNPADDVIGARSFGANPSLVSPLVSAAVQGLHDGGVGATIKHFPGLGGAPGDPHVALPTDPESEAVWEQVQLPSFRAGVAAGADAVMVTAVYVPGLGAGNVPAMFSPAVVGRVRTQLGFGGVIMTDSLSMGGIANRWSLADAAVMALAAGNDMLLLGNGDPAYEASVIAAVRAAVLSGRLDRARLHESAVRVNALRDRWGKRLAPCRTP